MSGRSSNVCWCCRDDFEKSPNLFDLMLFFNIPRICFVFVLGFSSRCQNLNCSERSPYNNAVRRIVLSLVLVVHVCTYFYRVSFLVPFYVGTGTISNIRAV